MVINVVLKVLQSMKDLLGVMKKMVLNVVFKMPAGLKNLDMNVVPEKIQILFSLMKMVYGVQQKTINGVVLFKSSN